MSSPTTAHLVRQLRGHAGITQTGLARRARISQSAVSDYERGRKEPSVSMLQRLAAAVDLVAEVHYVPVAMIGSLADLRRHRPSILAVCERHGASSPRVFGSVLGRRFGPESDIDLVVDLEPGRTLFDMAGLHDDLTELLGREVDVLTSGSLHGRMSHVAVEAVPL